MCDLSWILLFWNLCQLFWSDLREAGQRNSRTIFCNIYLARYIRLSNPAERQMYQYKVNMTINIGGDKKLNGSKKASDKNISDIFWTSELKAFLY